MPGKQVIMVVDDDENIAQLVRLYLEKEGFEVVSFSRGDSALTAFKSNPPALLLLDIMLPGMDGWQVCRAIRQISSIPIIMLSAKDETFDKVLGLELGADDYMTKPFSTRELISRIKAVLRRSRALSSDKPIEIGKLSLDPKSQRITADNKVIDIGPTEYRLLAFFMSHPERAYTRTQLLDQVWGGNVYIEDRTIDVHIRRLRKLLQPYGCSALIQTVRGTGYRFSSLVE